jgi:O-antigen ligase
MNQLKARPLALLAIVAVLAISAGATGLVFSSPYSPLLPLAGVVMGGIVVAWLVRPVWALYAALVLVFLPHGLIPDNISSLLNRSVTVVAAAMWLVRLLWDRKKVVFTGPAVFMLAFLAWSTVTLLWAGNMSSATQTLQVYVLRFLLFLFLIPNQVRSKKDLDGLMTALALTAWILVLSFIWTLLQQGYTAGSRLSIFGGNENGVAVTALMGMIPVLWHSSQPSQKYRLLRVLTAGIYIALAVGLVAMSGSRGGALSLVATFVIMWAWRPLRGWAKLVLLVGILALIFTPSLFTTLIERFAVEGRDTFLGGRESLWAAAWQVIQRNILGGVGIGNAPYAVMPYLQTDPRSSGVQSGSVHNPILTIWSETGIPGIIFYLGVLLGSMVAFVRQNIQYRKAGSSSLALYFALLSSITIGYMLSWIKGGGMQFAFDYFLILALLILPSLMDLSTFGVDSPAGQPPAERFGP